MSTACDNFKPHRWKPRQCAACFRPKAEHSGITSDDSSGIGNSQTSNSNKMKQSPFYKRFSFSDEDDKNLKVISRDPGPTQTVQHSTAPTSSDTVVTSADKLQKPDSENEVDETNEKHSSSPPTSVVESNCSESGTKNEPVSCNQASVKDEVENSQDTEAIGNNNSDMSGNTPPRPPPPRVRSHSMAAPRIKPRKHVPEPTDTQLTLSRSLQPVPAPRRIRVNRSISPTPVSSCSLDDSSIGRAKSLDNLDASPLSDRKVKFNLETTTIPDTSTAARKNATINPYAVSKVSDVVGDGSTEVMQDKNSSEKCMDDDNDDHEYIEADQFNAAVVSVTELKNKHRNGKPSQVTKYSTLSALQPTRQQNGKLLGGTKQKALSSGTVTMKNTPRRHAPPPPGAPRTRSATIASIDRVRMQNYSAPRRPPPPAAIYYTNAKIAKSTQANVTPVAKVPPPKPVRTPSTFDYENVSEVVATDAVEYSVIDNNDVTSKRTTKNAAPSGPKKPVRMPKEATPVSDGDQPPSQPKGRYIDLDIDLLTDQQSSRQVTKYQNFDDFSPRPLTPERTSPDCFIKSLSPFEGASQVHDAILNSLNAASTELRRFYLNEFSFVGKMACSKWSDFDPAPSGAVSCVKYNGKLLSVQDFSKERVDGEKATRLPPHPNVCRGVAFFADNPPSKLVHKFKIKKGRMAAITDHVPMLNVAEFVKQNFVSMKQLEYDRHVLLILVQLFSALKHLQQNGTVHRDISAETCRYDPKSGIMKLTDFTYALQRPPPITSSTFVYGYAELKWLGGTGSKLPPEIINTPDDCQTLDYSMSDCFAAGCMIYELFGLLPPFDKDEKLISKNYKKCDLAHIPKRSQYSNLINQLIYLLVQVDKTKRIKPDTALLLVQAILWGPVSWLHDAMTEDAIQDYLAVEKARLITSIAINSLKGDEKPSVELILKNMFIHECNPSNLVKALSLLNTE